MCEATRRNAHRNKIGKDLGPRTRPEERATSMCPEGSISFRVRHFVALHFTHSGFASGMSVKTIKEAFMSMP